MAMRVRDAIRCLAGQETETEAELRSECERMADQFSAIANEVEQLRDHENGLRARARLEAGRAAALSTRAHQEVFEGRG